MQSERQWSIIPFSEAHGKEICTWVYPAPYDLYQWPQWDQMINDQYEFADAKIREEQYAVIVNTLGTLYGFAQFFPIVGVTRLGLGLRPDLCGQGIGTEFVKLVVAEAITRVPGDEIDLEVVSWNERARKVYAKAGFEWTDTYEKMTPTGVTEFHCMVYKGISDK